MSQNSNLVGAVIETEYSVEYGVFGGDFVEFGEPSSDITVAVAAYEQCDARNKRIVEVSKRLLHTSA